MKHIVITGSTRGIGFGLAKYFLKYGNKVSLNGRNKKSVDNAISKLKDFYPDGAIQGYQGDVTNNDDIINLWEKAYTGFGEIDIWINNAGTDQENELFWHVSDKGLHNIIDLNLKSTIMACKFVFNKMLKQGKGQIYNMEGFGSDGMMMNKLCLYGTTKRAVTYFTKSMAREAKDTVVNIGRISPGMVITDLLLNPVRENTEEAERTKKIFNILADDVDTATEPIVKKILGNQKNNHHIRRMTRLKVMYRFMFSWLRRKDYFN